MQWGNERPDGPRGARPRRRNAEGFEIPPDGGRDARRRRRRNDGAENIDGVRWDGSGADRALSGAKTGQPGNVASCLIAKVARCLAKTELK